MGMRTSEQVRDDVLRKTFDDQVPDTTTYAPIGQVDRASRMVFVHVANLDGPFRRLLKSSKLGALREEGRAAAIGRVTSVEVEPNGSAYIGAEITDDVTLAKVEQGALAVLVIDRDGERIRFSLADHALSRAEKLDAWKRARAEGDYLDRVQKLEAAAPPPLSAAHELLQKADAHGGDLGLVAKLFPDVVARERTERLPDDILPSDRLRLLSLRSGAPMNEILKADYGLQREYDAEMAGNHAIQRERRARFHKSAQRGEALRKAVTASGPIPIAEVEVIVDGRVVSDAVTKGAWLALVRAGHARARGVEIRARGAAIRAEDVAPPVEGMVKK